MGKEKEFLNICIKSKEGMAEIQRKAKGQIKKRAQSPSNFSEQKSMPFAVSDSMPSVFRVWEKAGA